MSQVVFTSCVAPKMQVSRRLRGKSGFVYPFSCKMELWKGKWDPLEKLLAKVISFYFIVVSVTL